MKYEYDRKRGNRHQRGYTNKWYRAAKRFLAKHKWCVHCEARGIKTLATEVDHIIPHKGDRRLFWRERNWQGLCKPHHSAKTRSEMNDTTAVTKGHDANGEPLNPGEHWLK